MHAKSQRELDDQVELMKLVDKKQEQSRQDAIAAANMKRTLAADNKRLEEELSEHMAIMKVYSSLAFNYELPIIKLCCSI
jgi:hypothetical protein